MTCRLLARARTGERPQCPFHGRPGSRMTKRRARRKPPCGVLESCLNTWVTARATGFGLSIRSAELPNPPSLLRVTADHEHVSDYTPPDQAFAESGERSFKLRPVEEDASRLGHAASRSAADRYTPSVFRSQTSVSGEQSAQLTGKRDRRLDLGPADRHALHGEAERHAKPMAERDQLPRIGQAMRG
jgi:hypothetical protein